ncbi:MAG: hypothetical protein HY072_05060, partial [Deltaproteobacteria bacterium]|nr:hypothetical protein [Deltaproteobacteria bacterium]
MNKDYFLEPNTASLVLGPFHPFLPGPMRLHLSLDGEIIVSALAETGLSHKGLESALEKSPWRATIPYCDHLDPECSMFGELAFCMTVEAITGITVPPRAQMVRLILSELGRISSHLRFIVLTAKAVGSETVIHYALREREKILDLFELLTGARFSHGFLCFGGVRKDITEGFIERLNEICELLKLRLKEYNDLFSFHHGFVSRSVGVGVLGLQQIKKWNVSGPNARASGLIEDVRNNQPYVGYESIDFKVICNPELNKEAGDCHDRYLLRLREIDQSTEILKQASELIPKGEILSSLSKINFAIPPGEARTQIESPRG